MEALARRDAVTPSRSSESRLHKVDQQPFPWVGGWLWRRAFRPRVGGLRERQPPLIALAIFPSSQAASKVCWLACPFLHHNLKLDRLKRSSISRHLLRADCVDPKGAP